MYQIYENSPRAGYALSVLTYITAGGIALYDIKKDFLGCSFVSERLTRPFSSLEIRNLLIFSFTVNLPLA